MINSGSTENCLRIRYFGQLINCNARVVQRSNLCASGYTQSEPQQVAPTPASPLPPRSQQEGKLSRKASRCPRRSGRSVHESFGEATPFSPPFDQVNQDRPQNGGLQRPTATTYTLTTSGGRIRSLGTIPAIGLYFMQSSIHGSHDRLEEGRILQIKRFEPKCVASCRQPSRRLKAR
jgi:hypothetical protein